MRNCDTKRTVWKPASRAKTDNQGELSKESICVFYLVTAILPSDEGVMVLLTVSKKSQRLLSTGAGE